jgi:hypothetical protein
VNRTGASKAGFFARALAFALPCFAALAAALLAHVAIDVVGDYVLASDAYDTLDHGSRWGVSVLAFLAAAGAMWAILRAALVDAKGSHGALRDVLRSALPSSTWPFVLIVAGLSGPVLLAMAGMDAAVAGRHIDDLHDLVGGSYVLAAALTALCAASVACATVAFLRLLCRKHRAILRVVEAFVRRALDFARPHGAITSRRVATRSRTHSALRRCTSGNRAPPALLLA